MPHTKPSTAVVEAVARTEDVHPNDLPPLYDAMDPDAFDALAGTIRQVTVEYAGYDVTVTGDGEISLAERETATPTIPVASNCPP
jgi:hypothetical protein